MPLRAMDSSNHNALLQPAYVLSIKPYRNTSALLLVFTKDYGCLSVIAKGAKRSGSKLQLALQPFQPLKVSWLGQSDLKTLTDVEPLSSGHWLQGPLLYSGLYLNELLSKLLKPWDAHSDLFDLYHQALSDLVQSSSVTSHMEQVLRRFELQLLDELGYGLPLDQLDAEALKVRAHYGFDEHRGLFCLNGHDEHYSGVSISGESLWALVNNALNTDHLRMEAKRWMRYVIQILLGGQPLNVRKTMMSQRAYS